MQTYWVVIRDGRLALAVAGALEECLARARQPAIVIAQAAADLLSARGSDRDQSWPAFQLPAGLRPHLVTLYEDGLLGRLEELGAAAYVGMPKTQEPRVVRWGDDAGAIMLPVASARDLVDMVAAYTPWQDFAVAGPEPALPARDPAPPARPGRRAAAAKPAAVARSIAAAAATGPLLLAGIPAAAAAAAPASPSADSHAGSTDADSYSYVQPSQPPSPGAVPDGRPAAISRNDDAETRRGRQRENEAAMALARSGFRVVQNPPAADRTPPADLLAEEESFDVYSPGTRSPASITGVISGMVQKQALRLVVNLADSPVTADGLVSQMQQSPVAGLIELIAINRSGHLQHIEFSPDASVRGVYPVPGAAES